jgi:hypothetical protein
LISEAGAPDAVYEELEESFSVEEIVALTFAIVAINGWNRLAISMRAPVGASASPLRLESNRLVRQPPRGAHRNTRQTGR